MRKRVSTRNFNLKKVYFFCGESCYVEMDLHSCLNPTILVKMSND